MHKRKEYLGDGVYVSINPFNEVELTTENGISVTNRIVLEPEVLRNFWRFAQMREKEENE